MQKPGLFKSTAWYGIGNLFSRFIGFLLLPLYSNVLLTEEFGYYALIMSVYAVLSVFFQLGLQSAFAKFYFEAKDDKSKKNLFSTLFNSVIIISFFLSLVVILFSSELSYAVLGKEEFSSLFMIMIAALLIDTITYHIQLLLKTEEKSRKIVIITSIYAAFNFIFNLFFVVYYRQGVEGILLSQLLSGIFLFFMLFNVGKNYFQIKIDTVLLKKLFIFSFPLFLAGIFTTLVDVIDRFFLDYFFDKETVGVYSFAYRIALVMNLFVISFRTAWVPFSLRVYKTGDYQNDFTNGLEKLVTVSILLTLFVSLFIDDIFNAAEYGFTIFSQEYKTGIIIIPVIMLGYFFNGIASYYSFYPYISGKTTHFLYSDLIAFSVNVFFNLLLIPLYCMMGAAIATLLSFIGGASYLFIISYEKIMIPYRKSKLTIIILSGLLFLLFGLYFSKIIIDAALIFVFILIVKHQLKINIKDLFRKFIN